MLLIKIVENSVFEKIKMKKIKKFVARLESIHNTCVIFKNA